MEEKAKKCYAVFAHLQGWKFQDSILSKKCAIASVKNEYKSNRELLFNLRSCGVIVNEQVYLVRLQNLINEEMLLIEEIERI